MEQARISAFNSQLLSLCNFLREELPHNVEISVYCAKLQLLLMVNAHLVYETFKEHALKHRKKILECDEQFLVKELKSVLGSDFIDLESILLDKNLTQKHKARVFRVLKSLVKLAE